MRVQDHLWKGLLTSPEDLKLPQNFIHRRPAPILFYKFYKFRKEFTFIIKLLRLYM
jgi:hypothetical protein